MRYLVPGPPPCPEVVAVFYIRPAEVPTLPSVEGDAQVERQNTVVRFLTKYVFFSYVRDIEMHIFLDAFSFYFKVEVMSDHPFLIFGTICIPYFAGFF